MTPTATGYFKVVATVHQDVSDEDMLRGPKTPAPPRNFEGIQEHGPDPCPGFVLNWVFPFDQTRPGSVEVAREAAEKKRDQVVARLAGADRERVRMSSFGLVVSRRAA